MMLAAHSLHASDAIIGDVFGTRFPGFENGYGASLLVQHTGDQDGGTIGASMTTLAGATLRQADADGYRVFGTWSVSLGASLGRTGGDAPAATLAKARVLLDYQPDVQWSLHGGQQYIHLDGLEGQLLTGSAEYRFVPRWGVKTGGGYAITGTLADRYGNLELDWHGADHLYMGVIDGRTGYDPATLGKFVAVRPLFEIYGGASIPIGKGSVLLGAQVLSLGSAGRRQSLEFGYKQLIGP